MSTCPRCKGHLTDSHRCPRRPYMVPLEILASAVAGGVLGLVLADSMLAVVAGAFIAVGINRALRS